MAYITTEQVKEIRTNLKKEFPNIKFSVVREHYSSIRVAIMQSNLDFETKYQQVNHYHLDSYLHSEVLQKITTICNVNNYDKSDSQSDYFDVGFYYSLSIGQWDKPYTQIQK